MKAEHIKTGSKTIHQLAVAAGLSLTLGLSAISTSANADSNHAAAQSADISLKHAIVIADDKVPGNLISAEFDDEEDGAQGGVYEIEFSDSDNKHELEVDAMTGKILSRESERLDRGDVNDYNTQQQAKIGMMEAMSIAEKNTEGRVVEIEFKNDRDYADHHSYYEVAAIKGSQVYELNIDADSGSVFDKEMEEAESDD